MEAKLPEIYMSVEDDTFESVCGCKKHPPEKVTIPMSVEGDVLTIDLRKWGAVATVGWSEDIAGIAVKLLRGTVWVDVIYSDPMKNIMRETCCGSGCCCTAHRCLCFAA